MKCCLAEHYISGDKHLMCFKIVALPPTLAKWITHEYATPATLLKLVFISQHLMSKAQTAEDFNVCVRWRLSIQTLIRCFAVE